MMILRFPNSLLVNTSAEEEGGDNFAAREGREDEKERKREGMEDLLREMKALERGLIVGQQEEKMEGEQVRRGS